MNRLLVLVAAGLLAAGCTKGAAKAVTAAAPEQPAVDFTHEPHVAAQLACTDCHEGIDKATRLEAGVRHVKVACGDCHDDDRKDFKVPARVKPVRFTFSHANHLPQGQGLQRLPQGAAGDGRQGDQVAAHGGLHLLPQAPARLPAGPLHARATPTSRG